MNLWAFQYLFSLFCCVIAVVTVYSRNPRDAVNRSFCLLCVSLGYWVFIQFGFSLCRSYQEAARWKNFLAIWPLIVGVGLTFTLQFTERGRLLKSHWVKGAIFIPAIAFATVEITTGLIFDTPSENAVGWTVRTRVISPLWITSTTWFVLCLLLMLFFVVHYLQTVSERHKRTQACVLMIALLFAAVTALRDIAVVLYSVDIAFLSPTAFALASAVFGYAILKNKLFSLTPMTAAESIVSTMDDMLLLVDTSGEIMTANRAAHDTLGYRDGELIGQPACTLYSAPLPWLEDVCHHHGTPPKKVTDVEVSFVRKNAATMPVSLSGTAISDENDNIRGVILIGRDITARKQSERETAELKTMYYQSQKLESIGRLAGGVAHDMNNILGAIMASALVIKEEIAPDSIAGESVDNVLSACYRGRDLTRNLLGFARRGKYVKSDISINHLVTETVSILKRTISKNINVTTRLEDELSVFEGDLGQIQSVLMNICINAADSIPKAGTVSIETGKTRLDEKRCKKLGEIQPGNYLQLKVIDTGTGMDAETLRNAFEPFFTTKPMGKGTGLGLAMAYGVVMNHGGAITIESEVGKGTTVTIYFPSTDRSTSPFYHIEKQESGIPHRTRQDTIGRTGILLVDDEPLFQSSAQRLIRKMGHEVFIAENGHEALETYEKNRPKISVVLLDMLMPGMSGKDVFYKLKTINPEVKILIISGFDKDENVDTLLSDGANGYLQKPFNSQTLSRELETVIRG
jgi:PAS domain S-box-containing protein